MSSIYGKKPADKGLTIGYAFLKSDKGIKHDLF
jgi:hypothetical protein